MTLIAKKGYGQLEPNHLSAQRNGQIYAQLPCANSMNTLENASFVKYDYANNECNLTGEGEWMLVYNEVKLYDPRHSYKDFVYRKTDFTDNKMYPRVMKTMPGDIFTTNLADNGTKGSELAAGDKLTVGDSTGVLTYNDSPDAADMVWQVVKVYTLADGQKAVKVQRIK